MSATTRTVEQTIADAAQLVEARREAFLADPDDPETNHKLRVSIRTLRSLVDFLSPWQKRKQNARVQRNLKRVVAVTSRLRELDVLEQLVGEAGGTRQLVEFCAAEAAAERAKVLSALESRELESLLERALDESRDLRWRKRLGKKGVRAKAVAARYDELASQLQRDLDGLDVSDYERMHDARKRVKQVRYVSEQFADLLNEGAADIAASMKAEQDRLGALCDARVNAEIVASFLQRPDLQPELADELRALFTVE